MTELALGTANWGASYGAPGLEARVLEAAAAALAAAFLAAGHALVDTAPAYGAAESMVGGAFAGRARVVTKLSPGSSGRYLPEDAVATVESSRRRLRVEQLEGVLLHDPRAALGAPDDARRAIDAVRECGCVDRVGVSVYAPDEALAAVDVLGADLLQVPCNVLDQRFLAGGCLTELARRGALVHVRSVFLNGVLLADPDALDGRLTSLADPVRRLRAAAEAAATTPLRLALAFARDVLGAAAVVCGAYVPEQLAAILDAWSAPALPGVDWSALAAPDAAAIDPRTWS